MANNARVTLVFDVQQDGSLKLATRNINDAAAATNNLNNAQNRAARGARAHSEAINGGVSSANNGTRAFARLKDSIDGSNGVVAAYATLATQAFAVSAAFVKLREAAQTEQLMRGLAEQSIRTGNSLNATARSMQEITGYAISMGDAMRAAAQVAAAGFSPSTMEALTQAATDSAAALGRNVPDALDRFIKGTTKLEPELLDEMGIMIKLDQATSKYAQTLGKMPTQLTASERATGYLNAVLEESKLKFEGMAEAAGVNPYDKLAAAFNDLLNNVLTTLNNAGIIDFVQRLADNSQFLTATLIWFGTTIIRQVIPGLYGTAAAAAAAAASLRDEAAALKQSAIDAEDKAAADRAVALEQAKTLKVLDSNKQAYTDYASAVLKSTDDDAMKTKALRSLSGQIGYTTRQITQLQAAKDAGAAYDAAELDRLEALKKEYQAQAKAIRNLEQAKAQAASGGDEAKALIARLAAEEKITSSMADSKSSFAGALQSAGEGGVTEAFSQMREGLASMKQGLIENTQLNGTFSQRFKAGFAGVTASIRQAGAALVTFTTNSDGVGRTTRIVALAKLGWMSLTASIASAGGVMNFARLAFTGLAMSVKILGMAMLNAIPIIGQAIMLIQLAIEYAGTAWNWIKQLFMSKEQKAFAQRVTEAEGAVEKAKEKVKEAQDALNESMKNAVLIGARYREFLSGAGVDASKQALALIAVNNNIADMVDRLKALREEEASEALLQAEVNKLREEGRKASGARGNIEQNALAVTDAALAQTEEYNVLTRLYANSTKSTQANIRDLLKRISDMPNVEDRKKAVLEYLTESGTQATKTSQNITDLSISFSAADKAAQEFTKGLVQGTSYDKLVESLQAVNNVVSNIIDDLTIDDATTKLNQIANQISESIVGLLDAPAQDTLFKFKAFSSVAQEFKTISEGIKDNATLQNSVRSAGLAIETELNNKAQEYLSTLETGLITAQQKLMQAQVEERTIQSMLALEKARFKAFQRMSGETKEAARAQDAHEDRLIALEQQKLSIQQSILEAQIAGIEAAKNEYKYKVEAYKLALEQLKAQKAQLEGDAARQRAELGSRPVNDGRNNQIQRIQREWDAQNEAINKSVEAAKNLDTYIQSTNQSIQRATKSQEEFNTSSNLTMAALRDAQTSLGNLSAQLTAGSMTEAERAARDVALELRIVQGISADINSLGEVYLDILNKQNSMRDKGTSALLLQARYAKQNLQTSLDQIEASRIAGRENLESRRETLEAIRGNAKLTSQEREAATAEIALIDTRLTLYNTTTSVLLEQARVTAQSQLLEAAYVDTSKEGLEVQQKALEIITKRYEEQQKLQDSLAKGVELEARIAAARRGRDLDPEEQRQMDLNAARQALTMAEEQLGIKIQGINLEYALLEAQRVQTVLELSTKKKILEAQLRSTQNGQLTADQQVMLNQLNGALNTLGRNSYNNIRDIAIQTAREEVNNKRREVELLSINKSLANTSDDLLSNVLRSMDIATSIQRQQQQGINLQNSINTAGVFGVQQSAQLPDLAGTLEAGINEINGLGPALEEVFRPVQTRFSELDDVTAAVNAEFIKLRTTLFNLTPESLRALSERENPVTPRGTPATESSQRQEAAASGIARARARGFGISESMVPGETTGLTVNHQDPGHAAGWSYDLQPMGRPTAEVTAFINSEVLKGAKAIWQGFTYELRNGEVARTRYTPSRNAVGDDIMHMRHGHLSYLNAITDTTDAQTSVASSAERASTALDTTTDRMRSLDRVINTISQSAPTGQPESTINAAEEARRAASAARVQTEIAVANRRAIEEGARNSVAVDIERLVGNTVNQKFGTNFQEGDTPEQANQKLSAMNLSTGGMERMRQYADQLREGASNLEETLYEEIFGGGKLESMSAEAAAAAAAEFRTRFTTQMGGLSEEAYKQAFPMGALSDRMTAFWGEADQKMQPFLKSLRSLGPQGEFVASVYEGVKTMSMGLTNFAKEIEKNGMSIEAVADLASAALNTIMSVTAAASNAKIANIDKEIAAEQKRDGKSAASLAKIDAMEKKKDSIARKAFNTNKKLMLAQAVISTASAIAMTLGQGGMFAIPIAAMIGAMGLAQIAIIAGTQYESNYSPKSLSTPSTLSIGKRGDSVNLAGGPNANAGGEVGYLRGAAGTGTNASNYNRVGSAYGGEMMRGYGNRGFVVGEKGPEIINPDTPISVTPANDVNSAQPINASFSIQALDASDVKKVLVDNRGNIIQMLREAANNSGQGFMEDVNVNVYTRPNIGKL